MKKGLNIFSLTSGGMPRAVVANADFDRLAEVSGGRAEHRLEGRVAVLGLAPRRGIEAVGDEIEQRPGNLLRVQFERARVGIEVVLKRDR